MELRKRGIIWTRKDFQMRKSLLLIVICVCVEVGARRFSSSASSVNASSSMISTASGATYQPLQKPSGESDLNVRIARIENGLLPPVIVKGRPTPAMNVAEAMSHFKVPGVSVAFFEHGQILWTRTYGFANVASKRPVTIETLFQAASISKPVAALAALRLVQDGKLSLDDNVNGKLRSWKVPESEFTREQKVTLRRILSHSAGLTVHGFAGYADGEPVPTTVQILNGEKPASSAPVRVDTVPGRGWRYSGGGYVVMQLLLMDIIGKRFPEILHDLVLQPAGMRHSTYEQPLPKSLASFAATPYRANGEPVKGGWQTYPEMAAAGLWTTPSDLARLAIEVQNEYAGKSSKILSQEMMHQMLTRQGNDWILSPELESTGQGLGFRVESSSEGGQGPRFSHGGSNEGFRCNLEAYIGSSQGFIIMTNSDNGDQLAEEFLGAVAKEYNWPDFQRKEVLSKIDPALLSSYLGTYEAPGLGKVRVTAKDAKLYLQADAFGSEPVELLPESENTFYVSSPNVTLPFVFRKDGEGVVSRLDIIVNGQTFEVRKVLQTRF
jgi:CubicO group peptidase (beta-lactamase class C family)